MARTRSDRRGGLGLVAQFALLTGASLAVVAAAAFALLSNASRGLVERSAERTLDRAVELTASSPDWRQTSNVGSRVGQVERFPVEVRAPSGDWRSARLVQARPPGVIEGPPGTRLIAPPVDAGMAVAFDRLLVGVLLALVLAGAGLAALVASRVTRPLRDLNGQVRQIALGDLRYRSRVRSGGEVGELARSLERLAEELAEAQEAELELSMRERELELAGEVREALLPLTTPLVEGYDPGALHLAAPLLGGGFHDWIERADGRLGMLVCDVAGQGLPAALIGASARATLRAVLAREEDPRAALAAVNRDLAQDVRRGMYVTALYALLDPSAGRVQVACAGHRLPLYHWGAADRRVRAVHPEGIALGLDRGAVFERSLELRTLEVAPGDRLLLAGAGAASARDPRGEELGERGLAQALARHAARDTTAFLRALRLTLEEHTAGKSLESELSLATLRRDPGP